MKMKMLAIVGVAALLSACSATTTESVMVEATTSAEELYRVKEGDNLMLIAERAYGCRSEWVTIYEANEDVITDPTLIFPGQVIEIPEIQ